MGIDITQWRVEIAKYWKYVGRRRHSQGKSQGVKTASATSCNPLLALMLAFCLITAPSLLLVAGDVERNPGPPKLETAESKLNIDDLGEVWEAVFTARTKSFKIGLKLRVPVDTLDSIATQFTDPGDRLLQTLKVWLKTATKPTWRAIVDALRNATIGEASLATDIEAKYCTAVETGQAGGQTMSEVQPTATDTQLQTLPETPQDHDKYTRTNLSIIKRKFGKLILFVHTMFQNDTKLNKEEFLLFLGSILPAEVMSCLPQSADLEHLFKAISINKLWSFWDYYLLEQVIEQFWKSDQELISQMEQYKEDLSGYETATKVKGHIAAALQLDAEASISTSDSDSLPSIGMCDPKYFKELSIKLDEPFGNCTLEYLRTLWKSLKKRLRLPPLTLLLHKIHEGCICVTWLIPAPLVPQATERAHQSVEFFQKYQILRVIIDHELVYEVKTIVADLEGKNSPVFATAVETGQAGGQTMSEVQPTATDIQLQTLKEELRRIKDQQLWDSHSKRRMDTLQKELQDSLRQIQRQAVKDKQAGQRQLQELTLQLQSMKQQPQETIIELKQQLQQTQRQMEENQYAMEVREGQLRELQLQLQDIKLVKAKEKSIPRPRQELQQAQQVEEISGGREGQLQKPTQQLQPMKRTATQPQKALMQQKTIREMKWQKESKAPEKMVRGSAASDSNMAYFNGDGSAKVYSYDSNTHKWHRLPDTLHYYSTLVVVQHILTMVGGYLSGKVTNSLLSLMKEGGAMKWLPLYPAMPTARCYTAAVCSGHSLIVTGGKDDGFNSLATVEVLDIDTKQWSTACSLPHPFSLATISICDEQLYLMADGYEEHSVLTCSVHELLQSQTQPLTGKLQTAPAKQTTKWQKVANAPHSFSSCATLCGQLIAMGGWNGFKDTAAIFGYNATKDSWEAMGDMPTARRFVLVAIVNGKLMAVGGHVRGRGRLGTATDVVEILC